MKGDMKLPFMDGLAETSFPKEHHENIQHLRAWLSYQPHLPELTDEHLHLFLHSCYDDEEKTKKTIESYFTMKTMAPELFANRDPLGGDVQQALDISEMIQMTAKTPEGYRVLVYRLSDAAASKYSMLAVAKTFLMVNDLLLSAEGALCPGYVSVFDMKGFSLGHLARLSPSVLGKLMYYIQECHPVRLKGIHIINTVSFMDKVLALLKPFLHNELLQMFHFHGSAETLKDFMSIDILPEEYGGKERPVRELHADLRRLMETRYADWFVLEEQLRTDEAKRVGKSPVPDHMFGVEGSFRKLDID
ncbi:alpha-tocopherol transfer protein-like [Bacillus rossius redtenbacheri]|uniref:alpha-tocopherol transfer protein-like n=1 Tax=Bacillus rossius redtenbacheri TaxID=93214 RepID=UPI002FDE9585